MSSLSSSNPPAAAAASACHHKHAPAFPTPTVTKDARYRASRKMKGRGLHREAANMLKNLSERAREEFGESSIETAAVYYELGHSLFLDSSMINGTLVDFDAIEEALEYMAKSCAILYSHAGVDNGIDIDHYTEHEQHKSNSRDAFSEQDSYVEWAKDQIPRVLIGIGDLHGYQKKHAEAIEVLLNAIPYREDAAKECKMDKDVHVEIGVSSLRVHRLLVETYVLAAEQLLMCPSDEDQVHGETQNVIVKGKDVGRLAQTYYDQAKEKLQDIVYMMASMEQKAKGPESSSNLESEKQDICHLATMLMEVGMNLASRIEEEEEKERNSNDPMYVSKKRKF